MAQTDGRIIMLNDASRARGGATGIALMATQLLRERGRDLVFVAGDDGDNPALHALGVQVVAQGGASLLSTSRLRAMRDGVWNARAAAFLSDWIAREGRPDDVWHLHGWSQIWSPAVFRALAPVMGRLVVHAHDYFNACPNGAFWNYPRSESCALVPLSSGCLVSQCDKRSRAQKLWRVARQAMLGRTFTGPDAPLTLLIHPGMREAFERSGFAPDRMQVLRNPVTPFLADPVTGGGNRGFLFVGRLDEEKGALVLARAAAAAGVPVTFVGEGPQAAAVAEACPGAVLTGWQDHAGIRRHAAEARALVMPSVYPEPFGLVAVEALGSGLPVLASHTALLAPEIVAADAGWAVDIRDVSAFAATLRRVFEAPPEEIAAMRRNAVAAAPTLGLSPAAWCDGLEAAYRSRLG